MLNHRPIARHILAAGAAFTLIAAIGFAGIGLSVTGGGHAQRSAEFVRAADWSDVLVAQAAAAPATPVYLASEVANFDDEYLPSPTQSLTVDELAGGPVFEALDGEAPSADEFVRRIDHLFGADAPAFVAVSYTPASLQPAAESKEDGKPGADEPGFRNRDTLVRNASSVSSNSRPTLLNKAGTSSAR